MQAYGQTDTGCVRTRNQDYIYFSPEQMEWVDIRREIMRPGMQ